MSTNHRQAGDRGRGGLHIVEDTRYAVLTSRDLRGTPLTIERLGRRFVLWRDESGQIAAGEAACPHRGADLGRWRVVDGCLECPYHGFRFAPDGACARVPCEGRARPIRPDLQMTTYPVREHRGIVWLCWGAPPAVLPPIPWFDELPRDDRQSFTRSMLWRASFPRVMEGNLDMHHFPFLHRGVAWGVGALLDPYDATLEGDVSRTRGVLRADDGAPYRGRGGLAIELSVRLPGLLFGEVGRLGTAIAAFTPIDATRTFGLIRYFVPVPVIGRATTRRPRA